MTAPDQDRIDTGAERLALSHDPWVAAATGRRWLDEIDRLRDLLAKHGGHTECCVPYMSGDCSCGWYAAQKGLTDE